MTRGRAIPWSAEEETFLRHNATRPRRELHRLFQDTFSRPDVSLIHLKSKCERMGLFTGRTGCFSKGHVPFNKGQRNGSHPGSKRTQFKSGHVPANRVPIGTERICSKDGYILIKVAQPNPYTGAPTRFVFKHRHVWEEANGPIPPKHIVRFLDGDKRNCALENLICVPQSVNARLNKMKYNDAPAELRATLLAQARLADRIGEIEPTPAQQYRARPEFVPTSSATPPAAHLRDLIVERVFEYDVRTFSDALDGAIARTVEARGYRCDIAHLVPPGCEPSIIHIDRARLKGRPDLRNRLRDVLGSRLSPSPEIQDLTNRA